MIVRGCRDYDSLILRGQNGSGGLMELRGKIIKGIAGFYYVHVENEGVFECHAKGVFRNDCVTPLVGDDCIIRPLENEEGVASIEKILPRKNALVRPAVANVDGAMIIFAVKDPNPNLNLLDRFLILMNSQNVETTICFNKTDKAGNALVKELADIYRNSGNTVIFSSVFEKSGIEEIKSVLRGKTTALAGPSGVGKSSIMNLLHPDAEAKTGSISEKIKRGRHTTRHSELFHIEKDTYCLDTPGFSSLYLEGIEPFELKDYYPEYQANSEGCRFGGCLHINEPDCDVKRAVEEGRLSRRRYDNYLLLYNELYERKKRMKY